MTGILSTNEKPHIVFIGETETVKPWMDQLNENCPQFISIFKSNFNTAISEMEKVPCSLVLLFEGEDKKASEDFLVNVASNEHIDHDVPIIISMTKHNSVRVAALLKLGAYDCILQNVDEGQMQHALNIFRQTVEEYQDANR